MFECPKCGQTDDDMLMVGKNAFGLCHHCQIYWFHSRGLFTSDSPHEISDEQRAVHTYWTEEMGYQLLEEN